MHDFSRRTLAICVLMLGATASFTAAAVALPCADYVSTGGDSEPGQGHLIGSETVSYTVGGGGGASGGGFNGGVSGSRTVSYEIGYYRFSDGRTYRIDCRDYTLA